MKSPLILITLLLLGLNSAFSQPTIGVYSFYFDKEIDFSLMQAFADDSEKKIQEMVSDPAFDLDLLLEDFHDFFINTAAPELPVKFSSEDQMLTSPLYQSLQNQNKYEDIEMYGPYKGYLPLGKSFDESFLALIPDQSIDGLMSISMQFFVRKNVLKTVIQAQVTMTIYNKEGKKAWNYTEFGLSEMGFTTVSGIIVKKQEEIMPMFESSISNLKEKMSKNLASRAQKSTKKL